MGAHNDSAYRRKCAWHVRNYLRRPRAKRHAWPPNYRELAGQGWARFLQTLEAQK